jgi:hypothetical protein
MVSPNNEMFVLDEVSKEGITNAVYSKLPFVFDATRFRDEPCLEEKVVHKKYEVYLQYYYPIPLLEPYVKFFPFRKVFKSNGKKWIDTNDSCRTFYRIHKGVFHVTCVHPRHTERKGLKKNPELIHLKLHQDSILFLPREWTIQIEPLDKDSILEKIQYYTPLNQIANAISKIMK